jgi:hypothetical protein
LSMFFSPRKWMPISPVNLLWLTDAHDLQGIFPQLDRNKCDAFSSQWVTTLENQDLVLNRLTFGEKVPTSAPSHLNRLRASSLRSQTRQSSNSLAHYDTRRRNQSNPVLCPQPIQMAPPQNCLLTWPAERAGMRLEHTHIKSLCLIDALPDI